ncbi:MAG: GNAT family N-acetyltransferase [Planctomycetota bacterium]|jgi:RimJ/RimL family protein N-acetyltransferase
MDPDPRPPRELRTERLWLRSGRVGDEPALQDALVSSRDSLHPWMSFALEDHDPEALAVVCRRSEELWEQRSAFVWRLWDPAGATLIGTVDLHEFQPRVPACGLGYWLRTSHVGRGLASEAVRAVVAAGRETLGLVRIEARCDVRNERSSRLLERVGFDFEGIAKHDDRDGDGRLTSDRVYARTWPEDA